MFIPFAIFSAFSQPDERAALLAYKTTVAFPTRLSTPGFLSQGVALGGSEQSGDPVTGESAVAAAAPSAEPAPSTPHVSAEASSEESVTTTDATQAESVVDGSAKTESCGVGAERATEKHATSSTSADVKAPKSEVTPEDDDATSSSSSSSDSDSDSDSDDEKPDKTEMTEPVVETEDKAGQKETPLAGSEEPASGVKTRAVPTRGQPSVPEGTPERAIKGALKGAPEVAKAVSEPTSEEVPAPSTAMASSEEMVDPAPVLCMAESIKAQAEVVPEKEAGVEVKSSEVSDAIPEPVTEGASDVAAEPTPDIVVRDPVTEVASKPEVEIKVAPETSEAVAAPEELIDPAPVITDAEEVRAEPEVAAAPEGTHYITLKILFTPFHYLEIMNILLMVEIGIYIPGTPRDSR